MQEFVSASSPKVSFCLDPVQYVALGPRVKVIILNILPELKPDGLKFSLKIDLMSLAIIAK